MTIVDRHWQVVQNLEFGITELEILHRYVGEMRKCANTMAGSYRNLVVIECQDKEMWEDIEQACEIGLVAKRERVKKMMKFGEGEE